jgi:6-phosphogluconate dehydrogenase
MRLGMIGLGRMGSGLTARLLAGGHRVVGFDRDPNVVRALGKRGAEPADSLKTLVAALAPPRSVWLMLPSGVVDATLAELTPLLAAGDIVIDGGNSHFTDDRRRARSLAERGLRYIDVGTSGGVWGEARGFCLMVGGEAEAVAHLAPIFSTIAPPVDAAPRTPGRSGPPAPAEHGWLHCGPSGSGHFVKMVHNGIEYGLMAAYAEGFNLLRKESIDVAAVAEVWRRGSVISSWLLDLTARALLDNPSLDGFAGRVADSGEGRWMLAAALDAETPVPMLATALFERFASRGEASFADRLLSAMRNQFGGHQEPR